MLGIAFGVFNNGSKSEKERLHQWDTSVQSHTFGIALAVTDQGVYCCDKIRHWYKKYSHLKLPSPWSLSSICKSGTLEKGLLSALKGWVSKSPHVLI